MLSWSLVDWALVGRSALWLAGLAVVLASLSWARDEALQHGRPWREVLAQPASERRVSGGLLLVSLGLLAGAPSLWEAALWLAFAVGFGFFTWPRQD
jgi:hypothetical protein